MWDAWNQFRFELATRVTIAAEAGNPIKDLLRKVEAASPEALVERKLSGVIGERRTSKE